MNFLLLWLILSFHCFFLWVKASSPRIDKTRELSDEGSCGEEDESYKIYSDETSSIYDHPWFTLIQIKNEGKVLRCGGSIINSRYIVSAAHCFEKLRIFEQYRSGSPLKNLKDISIILGEHDLKSEKDCHPEDSEECYYAISVNVSSLLIHPQYGKRDKSYVNDIALLRLKTSISFRNDGDSSRIKPICLPLATEVKTLNLTGEYLSVVGFGSTYRGLETTIKKRMQMKVMSSSECVEQFFGKTFKEGEANFQFTINSTIQMCVKGDKLIKNGKEYFSTTCNGDSGGPLVYKNKYLIGIVSFGSSDCGNRDHPSVFINVSYYNDWIVKGMKNSRMT